MRRAISDLEEESQLEILLPSSLFYNPKLSFLEAIVVYLREIQKLSYSEIARLTNRDPRTIWTSYNRASKKLGSEIFSPPREAVFIPLSILQDRSLSIMEGIVHHLRASLKNKQVAKLLFRSPKAVSIVYNRARAKNG